MIEYSPAPLDHVIHLLAHSDIHRKFTMEQADKLFIPPVNLRQNTGIFEFGHLVAWASWVFVERPAISIGQRRTSCGQ